MTPYRRYLADGALPVEPEEGKKVKRNAARYTLADGVLFRHGFTHPTLGRFPTVLDRASQAAQG